MKPTPHPLAIFSLAFVAGSTSPVSAQESGEVSITAKVLTDEVVAGEVGQLFYKVAGADADLPGHIEAEGLEIDRVKGRSSFTITGGKQRLATTHFYRFRGDTPGTYTIPPLTVTAGGETLSTRPIEITILEPGEEPERGSEATRPLFGKLELATDEFYVHEIVPFTLTAHVRGRNSIGEVGRPELEHESFVFEQYRNVRSDGGELGGTYYSAATFPSHLFALKPGEHRLGPAKLPLRALDSGGGLGVSAFFQRAVRKEITTNAVPVTVKPLPEGAPASFTGGVGRFELEASPSTTAAGVGDPISLKFVVSGTGNLRTMEAPVFATPQKGLWKSREPSKTLEDEDDSDGFTSGRARFSRVLIPQTETDTIPAFELTYFDPEEESYVTATTDPIPATIADTGGGSAPVRLSGSSASAPDPAAPAADPPTARFDGMMHIRTNSPRWIAGVTGWSPGPWFYVVQGVLSVAFFTIVGFGVVRGVRRFRTAGEGRPLTFRRALRRLPGPGAPRRDYYRAVKAALSAWRSEHPEAPAQVREVTENATARCDAVLYSGNEPSDDPVSEPETAEFQTILHKLPRQ